MRPGALWPGRPCTGLRRQTMARRTRTRSAMGLTDGGSPVNIALPRTDHLRHRRRRIISIGNKPPSRHPAPAGRRDTMRDILGYRNKRVVVSGCFSGMGEATARTLVELGAEVHGLDYKDTALS